MPKRSFRKFPAHIRSRDRIYLPEALRGEDSGTAEGGWLPGKS